MSSRKTQLGRNLLDGKPAFQEERRGGSVTICLRLMCDERCPQPQARKREEGGGRRKKGKEEGPEEGTQWAGKLSQVSKAKPRGASELPKVQVDDSVQKGWI